MLPQKLKTLAPRCVDFARSVLNPRAYMESTFAPFYEENRWGDAESTWLCLKSQQNALGGGQYRNGVASGRT